MSTAPNEEFHWFAVRCVFAVGRVKNAGVQTYEERITLWRARDFDEAIALAETEAGDYAAGFDREPNAYVGLAQCYELSDQIDNGAEVFSLMRDSRLGPQDYVTQFFDSGDERQAR